VVLHGGQFERAQLVLLLLAELRQRIDESSWSIGVPLRIARRCRGCNFTMFDWWRDRRRPTLTRPKNQESPSANHDVFREAPRLQPFACAF
jgi:hypothetical protein